MYGKEAIEVYIYYDIASALSQLNGLRSKAGHSLAKKFNESVTNVKGSLSKESVL